VVADHFDAGKIVLRDQVRRGTGEKNPVGTKDRKGRRKDAGRGKIESKTKPIGDGRKAKTERKTKIERHEQVPDGDAGEGDGARELAGVAGDSKLEPGAERAVLLQRIPRETVEMAEGKQQGGVHKETGDGAD
jgi:hypothetical protein